MPFEIYTVLEPLEGSDFRRKLPKRMDFFRVAEGLGPAKNIEIERWVYILVRRGLEGNIFTLFV